MLFFRRITKYHTVRPVPTSMKNNKIPHCQNSSNIHEKQQNTTVRAVLTEE
jgi:hypothetical protein